MWLQECIRVELGRISKQPVVVNMQSFEFIKIEMQCKKLQRGCLLWINTTTLTFINKIDSSLYVLNKTNVYMLESVDK